MAAGKKNATRLKAFLVFLDETGLMMAPLVRRSWSRRGQTPILSQRTRSHQKVSAIAALCIAPNRDRVQLFFRLHLNANINSLLVIDFLRQLRKQINQPLVLIWDRLQAHRAKKVQAFFQNTPNVHSVLLPPYAPELNPVEYVWSYIKLNPMANYAFFDIDTLASTARRSGRSLQRTQTLLRSFIHHSPLPLDLS